ncbi:glycosyltransferase family 39 protein [Sphingomonas sp. LHG3406-1]|uniref:ArnT family glycosyltransferase n=1 Tax=Sphingomonas sp. LHG3406-1 TaxID=2804617 RepID=UPI0026203BED|nr:glycosyltransferase family 39 protein [Sphingomonas sp. LHG3406-1]
MSVPSQARPRLRFTGLSWGHLVLLFLALAVLFLGSDGLSAPIALRDEARNANNALDMALSGFGLVVTYDFRPDLWNTKPPLAIWLMSGSLRLFGPSEWALRLPSALAALGTLATTLWFVRKVTGSRGLAIGSAILLLLSPGFFGEHGARTADFDATLLFFVTAGLQLLYLALLKRRPSWQLLLASGALVGLGALTKSIAAFIPVTGILLFILLAGRFGRVLSQWQRYALAAAAALLPLLAFYAAREAVGPGYLAAVAYNDVVGRLTESLITRSTWTFYFEHLGKGWFFAGPLLVALPLGLRGLNRRERVLALYTGCILVTALLVYSVPTNRAMQYALPLFPWLAIIAAIALKRLLDRYIVEPWTAGERLLPAALGLALCLIGSQLTARAMWWRYEGFPARQHYALATYGDLFAALAARGVRDLIVVDPGTVRQEETGYAPLLRWHRLVWAGRGLEVTRLLAEPASFDRPIASCEPEVFGKWRGPDVERVGLCAVRWPTR